MEEIKCQPIPEKDYILLNANNMFNGFYNNKIHSKIPEGCIEITKDVKRYIMSLGKQIKIKDVTLPITEDNVETIEPEPIEYKPSQLEQLRADVDFLMIMEGCADV